MKYIVLILLITCNSCEEQKPETVTQQQDTVQQIITSAQHSSTLAGHDALIVPGRSIGKTILNSDAANLEANLGKPDMSDAAMGKAWLTWYSNKNNDKPDELNIYTTYADSNMNTKTVQQIRITSPFFKTADNIGSGSKLATIKKYHKDLKAIAKYGDTIVYDVANEGIAFEIRDNTCTGIIVYQPDRKVTDIYIMLHPNMEVY